MDILLSDESQILNNIVFKTRMTRKKRRKRIENIVKMEDIAQMIVRKEKKGWRERERI